MGDGPSSIPIKFLRTLYPAGWAQALHLKISSLQGERHKGLFWGVRPLGEMSPNSRADEALLSKGQSMCVHGKEEELQSWDSCMCCVIKKIQAIKERLKQAQLEQAKGKKAWLSHWSTCSWDPSSWGYQLWDASNKLLKKVEQTSAAANEPWEVEKSQNFLSPFLQQFEVLAWRDLQCFYHYTSSSRAHRYFSRIAQVTIISQIRSHFCSQPGGWRLAQYI